MTSDTRLGLIAGISAYFLWGVLPVYLKTVGHIAPEHVLYYRIVWSVPTAFLLLTFGRRWNEFWSYIRKPSVLWLLLSSALIGMNWFVYIWAVGESRVMEASLGYFINPLVNVAIGAIFLSERLRKLQWLAVALASIAVIVETVSLGRPPIVALFLCMTFAFYGLIRRQVQVDGRVGFALEVLLLLPIALFWGAVIDQSAPAVWQHDMFDLALLSLSGPITAAPLILFALAAKRLQFSTIGFLQYIGPSLQFLLAIYYGEALTAERTITFALIWAALVLFSFDAYRVDRKQRRETAASGV